MGWKSPLYAIPGTIIFFIGLWFDFGVFVSGDPDMPISWEMFIIPVSINAIGIALIVYGIRRGNKIEVKEH